MVLIVGYLHKCGVLTKISEAVRFARRLGYNVWTPGSTNGEPRLHLPANQQFTLPESSLIRMLYDCPEVPADASGHQYRHVGTTHPKGSTKQRSGVEQDGLIYELCWTKLPQEAFTASDVMALW